MRLLDILAPPCRCAFLYVAFASWKPEARRHIAELVGSYACLSETFHLVVEDPIAGRKEMAARSIERRPPEHIRQLDR